ncbi:MAG: hypothetical protein ACREJX_14175 [Polyangiaceae bacterium]
MRLMEHVHGHLGWMSVAVLIHPAIVLWRKPRADWAVGLALAFTTFVGGLGVWLYGAYREKIKQSIFIASPRIGLFFERKEHLAFGAIALAWVGALAYFAGRVKATELDPSTRDSLREASRTAFLASAVLAFVAATLGTVVATFKTF